jgi:hypothetical protein
MGMYTGIYFKAKLKPLALIAIETAYRELDFSEEQYDFWLIVNKIFPISRDWLSVGRRHFIPMGGLSYMPPEWQDYKMTDGISGDTWTVCCSLKNYDGEIESFLEGVLPFLIEERCTIIYLYEEWDNPKYIEVYPA